MDSSNNDNRRGRGRHFNNRNRNDRNDRNERNNRNDWGGDGSSRDLLAKKRPELFRRSYADTADKELSSVDRSYAEFSCKMCGQPIEELSSAMADKQSGEPVHFDCVIKHLQETESLKENEKIVYIGQGRFAVAYFENPHDLRNFNIVRIIEWEARDKKFEWRSNIAGVYSQIH